ncbi:MAG: arsenic efflux protein [Clostridia bacterium]|nr:arsenic efflux protein [Clostridia bacterium]
MEEILHELLHALIETLKTVPFLFLAYLLMEFIEHKASDKMERYMEKIGNAGPAICSALGCIPQCGFSASASNLYTAGLITEGTLIAVFLTTSDEALPILLSTAGGHGAIWKLILCKIGIGIISGFAIDFVLKKMKVTKVEIDICKDCGCEEEEGILKPSLKHTLKISVFILLINVALGLAIHFLGEDRLSAVLLSDSLIQPFITALIGLIPNCAVSVMITNLYIEGALSFGSAIAGLCSGAGIGLTVLLKSNKCKKENIRIIAILYGISALFGFALMLFGIN